MPYGCLYLPPLCTHSVTSFHSGVTNAYRNKVIDHKREEEGEGCEMGVSSQNSFHTPLTPHTPQFKVATFSALRHFDFWYTNTGPFLPTTSTTTMQRFTMGTVSLLLLCTILLSLATAEETDSLHSRVARKAKCEITPQCEARCKYCGGGDKKCPASGICGGGYTCKGKAACDGKECVCKKT